MRVLFRFIFLILVLIFASSRVHAQDTLKLETLLKSVRDIPHRTLKQKWIWPHRSIVFLLMQKYVQDYDTAYYSSYKGELVITIPVTTRFTSFELKDAASSNSLKFSPNYQYDLGVSVNSKFSSFLINTGVTFFKNNEGTEGKTTYKDYQFNFYGRKTTVDLSLQSYKGFYIRNSDSYESFNTNHLNQYEVRPDVSVFSIAYNSYHLFNHKKFSYRSSFAFTEHQKKSAGSFLAGGYFSFFEIRADSSLVSHSFASSFNDSLSSITGANVFNYGLNLGYIYTLVIKKKVYTTLSLVQGLGVDQTSIIREDDLKYVSNSRFASKQHVRIALGYDGGKLFFGTMGLFDFYYFDSKEQLTFNYSYGKFRVFVGYRFLIEKQQKKLLQKLTLIDY